jgi:hypothetical protein
MPLSFGGSVDHDNEGGKLWPFSTDLRITTNRIKSELPDY